MGYTHLVTADDIRVAGELGALLDKEFFAQGLLKFPSNAEKGLRAHIGSHLESQIFWLRGLDLNQRRRKEPPCRETFS
jgi:hypothetical protein